MSKRVYEIARELDLESKEVISRLREAGVEVKSHSSSVEDPVYERVFGDGANGAQNGRSEAQEVEAREARGEAERSGHGADVAASPAEEPVSAPPQRKERRRRRVVIDASATNRASRPATAPAAPKETERAPVEEAPERTGGVRVEPGATVKDLGEALGVPPSQIIKVLMSLGEMKTLTQTLSTEEIELVAEELGREVEIRAVEEPGPEDIAPDEDRKSTRLNSSH